MWCWFDIIIDAHTEYVSCIIHALVWNTMKRKLPLPYPRCEGPCLPLDLIPYSLWKVVHEICWAFSNTPRLFSACIMSNLKMHLVSMSSPTWKRQYVAFSPDIRKVLLLETPCTWKCTTWWCSCYLFGQCRHSRHTETLIFWCHPLFAIFKHVDRSPRNSTEDLDEKGLTFYDYISLL